MSSRMRVKWSFFEIECETTLWRTRYRVRLIEKADCIWGLNKIGFHFKEEVYTIAMNTWYDRRQSKEFRFIGRIFTTLLARSR